VTKCGCITDNSCPLPLVRGPFSYVLFSAPSVILKNRVFVGLDVTKIIIIIIIIIIVIIMPPLLTVVMMRIFGPDREKVTIRWRKFYCENLHDLSSLQN
jgi:hypothetical protein